LGRILFWLNLQTLRWVQNGVMCSVTATLCGNIWDVATDSHYAWLKCHIATCWDINLPCFRHQRSFVEVEVNLRPTVSRPVRLGIGPPFETLDQILSCSSFFCWQLLDYSS
jgi:hypothetical protein